MQILSNQIKIAVSTSKGTCFFTPSEIVRLEASSNYTNIYFINNTRLVSSKVLKKFAQVLEPLGFLRTHRAHLINRQHITLLRESGGIVMQDASVAEVSRRKKAAIKRLLKS